MNPVPATPDTSPSAEPRRGARSRSFPLIVYLLAALLRLIPVLLSRELGIGLDDMFQYDMLGRSLAAGDGFRWYAPEDLELILSALERYAGIDASQVQLPQDPRGIETSFRAPLYPALLAAVYALSGLESRFFAARLVQALLTASLAPLTYGLARQLGAATRWARAAALVSAAWPLLILFPLALATENLFLPLLALGTLLAMRAASGRERDALLAGVVLGLATLTRSVIVGFPLLAGLWLGWRVGRRQALLLLIPFFGLLLPWTIRNSQLHGGLTFIETSLGYNLYLGYHPEGDGSFLFGPSLDLVTILDDAERDAVGRARALEFIRVDPARVPLLALRKLGHLWGLEDRAFTYFYSNGLLGQLPGGLVGALLLLLMLPLVIVLPSAVFGWIAGSKDAAWWIATLLLGWYVGVHVLVMAEERFHLALVPVLAALAGAGMSRRVEVWTAARAGRRWAVRALVLTAAVCLLAFANWGFELRSNAPRFSTLLSPAGSSAGYSY